MADTPSIVICWFRRDLRLTDNHALHRALASGLPVLPLFIFDSHILSHLDNPADARVTFIHTQLQRLNDELKPQASSFLVMHGRPEEVWKTILQKYSVSEVFANDDYEPYAIARDSRVEKLLGAQGIPFTRCKDHVIFEKAEVTKADGLPYTVFTPYKNKWLSMRTPSSFAAYDCSRARASFLKHSADMPTLAALGFAQSSVEVPPLVADNDTLSHYAKLRDEPAAQATTHAGPHLRFGTISVRGLAARAAAHSDVFLSELIWRDFFSQILFHFPEVVTQSFKKKYDRIPWRNNEEEFARWCRGETGYPIVDAGMRQLNSTGFMHNRVRMITAGFLCKHLLIDWRWGEAYFARQLLDYDLASNNGNWQWAAGTGCDAAPYFRIFNPYTQAKKFDPENIYIRKWVPEFDQPNYQLPIVDHKQARLRALQTYKQAIL